MKIRNFVAKNARKYNVAVVYKSGKEYTRKSKHKEKYNEDKGYQR